METDGSEADQALAVRYVQKPQDKSADTILKLGLSPSYVTYNPTSVGRITDFFKTGQVGTTSLENQTLNCILNPSHKP